MEIDLKAAINKLNHTCRNSLESAAGLCLSRTHYAVDLEHWIIKLIDIDNTDLKKIFNHFSVNETKLICDPYRLYRWI